MGRQNLNPVSYFHRPFRSANSQPPTPSAAQQLSSEWEALESRLAGLGNEEGHRQVNDFLRRWGVALAQAEPAMQGPLASLLESARAALLGQLSRQREDTNRAQQQAAEARQRQAQSQAEHQRRLEAGRAEVRRLQEETARIQDETRRASRAASDRNHQLARAALFPEQHCPYCSRAYLDLTGGCWHCQSLHRPGHF